MKLYLNFRDDQKKCDIKIFYILKKKKIFFHKIKIKY